MGYFIKSKPEAVLLMKEALEKWADSWSCSQQSLNDVHRQP